MIRFSVPKVETTMIERGEVLVLQGLPNQKGGMIERFSVPTRIETLSVNTQRAAAKVLAYLQGIETFSNKIDQRPSKVFSVPTRD